MVTGDKEQLQLKEEEPVKEAKEDTNGTSSAMAIDVEDDIVEVLMAGDKKRPLEESNGNGAAMKARFDEIFILIILHSNYVLNRVEGGYDVEIMAEKNAEAKSAEDQKKSRKDKSEDGVVCIELIIYSIENVKLETKNTNLVSKVGF